ncbi:MAG: aminotransferase class V-fold PLP-dependent enzyme [Oscillospiraceae bacterium]|nr:aminotransferase class V-fold PLP-dependent enzyme [Oscillospiraceae bacterium]
MIYLDNAATSLRRPPCVIEAVAQAMQSLGNSGRGVNGGSLSAARVIYDARQKLADLFGCSSPERVCFTSNATEALNTAIFGLFGPGDHVITTDLEHNSVLRPLYRLEKRGVELSFVPADRLGRIALSDFAPLLRPNTRAVITTHASNLTGNLVVLDAVGAFAREHGLLYVVDASQTAGAFPIDMARSGISVLCFTGHKSMMGPQGTGGLCLAEGVEIRPLKTGGTGVQTYLPEQPAAYPTRLEAGTLNGHGIAGLSAAVDFLRETGVAAIHEKETALMRQFYDGVRAIPGVTVYGDFTGDRAPVVSLNIEDADSGEVADFLAAEYDIAVRSGAHCAPRMHRTLGTEAQGAVRFSFGWYNTPAEVETAIAAIRSYAEG